MPGCAAQCFSLLRFRERTVLQKCTWKHAPSPAIHMAKVKGDDETHASRRPEAWGVCVCVCVCVLVVGGRGQEGIKGRIQGKKLTRTTEGINTLDIQP